MAKISFSLVNGTVVASDKNLLKQVAVDCGDFKKRQKEFETDDDQSKGFISKFPHEKRVYFVDSNKGKIIPCVIRLNANKTFRVIDLSGKTEKVNVIGKQVWTTKKEAQEELAQIAREKISGELGRIIGKARGKIKDFSDKAAPVMKTGRSIASALLDEFKERTKSKIDESDELASLKEQVDDLCSRSKKFSESIRKNLEELSDISEGISKMAIKLANELEKRDNGRTEKE